MIRVQELSSMQDLAAYRMQWSALLPQTRGATFFQSLEWLETYWNHYGEGQQLRVLLVHDEKQLLGILPLVVRIEHTRLGPMRLLTYPLHDWGNFFGPIGPNPTVTLLAGMQHIRATRRDWDLIDLRWVPRDGADCGRTPHSMRTAGFETSEQVWMRSAQVDLSQGWEVYWAGRKSHWRTNVRSCHKKLARRGKVSYVRYRPEGARYGDGDPQWDLYDACEKLAKNSWQGTSATGTTLSHDEVRLFFRDAHARAAEAGALDINLFLIDGEPAAFAYNYHYRGYVTGLRMGFDHAVCRDGAGTALQALALEDSCGRGDHTYDLGPEYLECKRHWQTSLQASYRYTYYPPLRPRCQALRFKRWMEQKRTVAEEAQSSLAEAACA